MKINKLILASTLISILSLPAFAATDTEHKTQNPMKQNMGQMPMSSAGAGQDSGMTGKPMMKQMSMMKMMKMMEKHQEKMVTHMGQMETHMGKMEVMIRDTHALQKGMSVKIQKIEGSLLDDVDG